MSKQHAIKTYIVIAILLIVSFGCNVSFAAGDTLTPAGENMNMRSNIIYYAIGILSWVWFIPAKIAGMFLTNTRVYGEAIGFDSYLWLCWNLVKNISNFILWFLFVFYIFRMMFGKEEATGVLKNIVVKILVAGITIQSSWFIIAAILDVSTIATSAVGAIPSQVLANDTRIEKAIKNSFIDWKRNTTDTNYTQKLVITGFPNNDEANKNAPVEMVKMEWVPINTSVSEEEIRDMIMPNAENLEGPLVFMGASIIDSIKPIAAIDFTQDPMTVIIRIILDWGGILIYSLAMIALAIIALIRVFLLRGFIILSPLILLLFCLEKVGKEKVAGIDKIIGMLKNSFSLQSFLGLAFKPVIITLAISGALIVSILMKNAFKSGGDSTLEILPGTAITSIENKETINTKKETTYTTTMNTQTVNMTFKNMGKNFGEFLVTLVTLFLMAFIIKLAATSKTGIKRLDDKVGEAAKTVGRLAGNIPIIPIGANGGGISYSSVMGNDGLIDKLKTGGGTIAAWQKENETNMRKLFNIKDNKASEVEYNLLDKAIENAKNNNSINRKEFSTKTQELIAKDYEVGLGIPEWKQRASRWMEEISQNKYDSHISNTEPIYNFRRKWQTLNKIEDLNEKRKQALDDDQARNSYWKAFWWEGSALGKEILLRKKDFKK